jgi:hypothetical protein
MSITIGSGYSGQHNNVILGVSDIENGNNNCVFGNGNKITGSGNRYCRNWR